jgi:GT2 family glycosyltransferase
VTPLKVSIIIINWNGRHLLKDCLEALQTQTFEDFEIIVVDNGSEDGSVPWLRENYEDQIRLFPLSQNTGFSKGNNIGIRASRGELVALINNDVVVAPDWLAVLVECIERHPQAGMVGCKVLNYYRRDEIDNLGHLLYPDGLARGRGRLESYGNWAGHDQVEEILFPSACAALYRKDMLLKAGLFDETFFAYCDDSDLSLRGRLLGYKALYCPQAVAYHKYSQTGGAYSATKAFLVERNRIWLLLKLFPLPEILASPWYTFKRYLVQGFAALKGQGASGRLAQSAGFATLIQVTLEAYLAALKGVPRVLKERRAFNRLKRVGPAQFRAWLRQFALSTKELALKD